MPEEPEAVEVTPTETTPKTTEEPQVPETPEVEFTPLLADDLTFAEGIQVDEPTRDEFLGIINNQELTPSARAQALVDLHTQHMQKASEAGSQAWNDMQDQWRSEVEQDAELGGQKLEPVLTGIGKVLEQYGSSELRQVLDLTGAGNNIHVIRFMNNVAKVLNEGQPVSGAPANVERSLAEKMYPSMAKEQ